MTLFNRWLRAVGSLAAFTAVARAAPDESFATRSLAPPVLLPDGSEFQIWEQPLTFTRTYYVNGGHPQASDSNPGTKERPFATINHAAQILQPGERVVVAAGVYRECVRPARSGTAPDRMISYEAEPGAKVVIKGSRVFRQEWERKPLLDSSQVVWQARLSEAHFEKYNPFNVENVTPQQFDVMSWAQPLRGKPPYTLVRGLVFQDGRRLQQVAALNALSTAAGSYWVDRPNQTVTVRLSGDQEPAKANIEITTQESVFAPASPGLGFIRVKGFVIEHSAGPFPWEQVGAISTTRGHHWIIEDNTVRWANGVGIDLGVQMPGWPQPPVVGFHIVRRNVITDCGICGICGLGPGRKNFGLLIEDNILARNAFYDVERLFETGGIKTHNNVRCLIRRNLIVDTLHGAGIWMDGTTSSPDVARTSLSDPKPCTAASSWRRHTSPTWWIITSCGRLKATGSTSTIAATRCLRITWPARAPGQVSTCTAGSPTGKSMVAIWSTAGTAS